MKPYKFSERATEKPPFEISDVNTHIKERFQRLSGSTASLDLLSGIEKRSGWLYDYRPYLRRFLVLQYGHWQAFYAPNKTAVRKNLTGRIDEIHEINNKAGQ